VCGSEGGAVVSVVERMVSDNPDRESRGLLKRRSIERLPKNGHPRTFNRKTEKPLVPESCQTAVPLNCVVVESANYAEEIRQEVWRGQRKP